MPVFQGEKVEQEQQQRRVFKGERVNQQRPDMAVATADRGTRGSDDMVIGGGPLGMGQTFNLSELQRRQEGTSTLGAVKGAGEAALSTISGIFAEPIAGIAGLAEMGTTALIRDPSSSPLERAVGRIEAVRDALTYQPRTVEGSQVAQTIADDPSIQSLLRTARRGGEATLEATGSPAAATATQTFLEFLPGMAAPQSRFRVGSVRGEAFDSNAPSQLSPGTQVAPEIQEFPATGKARRQDIKRVEDALRGEGVNIDSRQGLLKTIERVGQRVQDPGFATSLDAVRDALVRAKGVEKQTEDLLWNQAREGRPAGVRRENVLQFENQLDEALRTFVIDEMGSFKKLRENLREGVANAPEGSAIKLSALMDWRKSLNSNMPSKKNPEQKVFMIAKRNLDNFLQTEFATDMIKGDPESLAKWQAAINKSAEFRELFEDDKIVRQLANHDATPEELRNLVFNSSSVGAKATAARTVKRLKRIFGEGSDEIVALRQESLYNLMEPLVSDTPDFSKFQSNYDRFVKKNPGLVRELFPEKSRDALRSIYSASKSARTRQAIEKRVGRDLADIASVGLFGHGIAQAGLRVRLARDIFSAMARGKNDTIKREVMRDFLGYDATKPLFSSPAKRAIVLEGMIQGQKEEQE